MGGTSFIVTVDGPDVETAFRTARDAAQYEYGHGGYTGTIAEKSEAVLFDVPAGVEVDPARLAGWILETSPEDVDDQPFIPAASREPVRRMIETAYDKWGPACALRTGPTSFVFFGWASS